MNFYDVRRNPTAQSGKQPATDVPVSCPTCRSKSITTAAKTPNADSYWRCGDCGEVWNGARRQIHGRMGR